MNAPVRRLKQPYRAVSPAFGRPETYRGTGRRRADPARRLLATAIAFGGIAAIVYVAPYLSGHASRIAAWLPHTEALRQWTPNGPTAEESSRTRPSAGKVATARPMPVCGQGYRINCIVDGDTIWVDRQKIRLETIDAPEVHGKCAYETQLAAKATRRLQALLTDHEMAIVPGGRDIYGRTLARVSIAGGEVGGILASEGLARRWTGHRMPWC